MQPKTVHVELAPHTDDPPLQVLAYATQTLHPGVRRLRDTAKVQGLSLSVIRCSDTQTRRFSFPMKIRDTRDALRKVKGNGLILITDAYDVRFLGGAQEITQRYRDLIREFVGRDEMKKIVLAGEKQYEHHHTSIAPTSWNRHITTDKPYVYPSTCAMIGPRAMVLELFEELVRESRSGGEYDMHGVQFCKCDPMKKACDQSLVGLWAFRNPDKCVIDCGAVIFWSARGEQHNFLKQHAEVIAETSPRRFRNRQTSTLPSVLHVPPTKRKR